MLGGFYFDPTYIIMLPAILLAMYAQFKVTSTFNKYSRIGSRRGMTGAEAARRILEFAGVSDVSIEHIKGSMTDHYDPRSKVLRLSDTVYGSTSISAIGVAAHEVGHAIQHAEGYSPLMIRNSIVPVVNISSKLSFPLIIIGIILSSGQGSLGILLAEIGIILFAAVVVFQLITLPVELNASSRAISLLDEHNLLADDEIKPARKVLNAAAMTYIAAAFTAIMNLIRFVVLLNGRRRD